MMIMRGGFLLGALVGAVAVSYFMSRRNNSINMARLGEMVTSAIGDGFKLVTASSGSASASSNSSTTTSNKAQPSQSDQAAKQQLKEMIAKDAAVQKEVNEIISQHSH
jgi:hypothetical protein